VDLLLRRKSPLASLSSCGSKASEEKNHLKENNYPPPPYFAPHLLLLPKICFGEEKVVRPHVASCKSRGVCFGKGATVGSGSMARSKPSARSPSSSHGRTLPRGVQKRGGSQVYLTETQSRPQEPKYKQVENIK
jgi:hypothetical protein